MATPNGHSLDVNVVAVRDATAPAVTAQTDAAPTDTAPTGTAPADIAQAGAQPADAQNWPADTPVQVAYFEGPDDTAPAEGKKKTKVGFLDFGWLELEAEHNFSNARCTDVRFGAMQYARSRNDHNTALRFCRMWMEICGIYILELPLVLEIVEIAHAVFGPEFWWWQHLPGTDPVSATFKWSWEDMLIALNARSRETLFGSKAVHYFRAAFCMRLPDSYGHKRHHNKRTQNAQYTTPAEGKRSHDNIFGFAFVRDDGAIAFLRPGWDSNKVAAYWVTDQLITAHAAKNFKFRQGPGGSPGPGTFHDVTTRHQIRLKFLEQQFITFADWNQNHGTPWGKRPPSLGWKMPPRIFKEDGEGAEARPPTAKERQQIIDKAIRNAINNNKLVEDWSTAPAAPVGTAQAASSGHSSAASDGDWEIPPSAPHSPAFRNVTEDTLTERVWDKFLTSARGGYSGDAPPVKAPPAQGRCAGIPSSSSSGAAGARPKVKAHPAGGPKAKPKHWSAQPRPPKDAPGLP